MQTHMLSKSQSQVSSQQSSSIFQDLSIGPNKLQLKTLMRRIQRIPKILSEPTKLNIKKYPTKAQKTLTNDGIIQMNVIGIKTVNA